MPDSDIQLPVERPAVRAGGDPALDPWASTVVSAWTGSYAHTYLILGAGAALAAVIAPLTGIRVSKKEML